MVRFWPGFAALLVWLIIFPAATSAQQLTTAWHLTELGPCIGCKGLIVSDLDGDDVDEILASNSGQNVTALKWDGNDFQQVWSSPWAQGSTLAGVRVYTPEGGATEIFILLSNGSIEVYGAPGFELLRSGTIDAVDAAALAVADLDGDGTPDIVAVSEAYLRVYDGLTFARKYATTLHRGTNVEVGDVTGDGVPNIVIGQHSLWSTLKEGLVLNGVTRQEEWRYAGGFGSRIALADVTGDGVLDIVGLQDGSYNSYVRAFDARRRTPLWELQAAGRSMSILVDDVTGDGVVEIVLGSEYSQVTGYSVATLTKTWEFTAASGLGQGVSPLAAGDVVGDGKRHLVYSAGASWGVSGLVVADVGRGGVIWQSVPRRGPFAVAIGDVTGDGHDEIVVASAPRSGWFPGTVTVLDRHHRTLASAPLGSSGYWYGYETSPQLQVADVTGDGRAEIFVSASTDRVWQLDGTRLTTTRETTARGAVTSLRVGDLNGNGRPQLVVSDAAGYVTVLDAETLERQWQTVNTGTAVTATALVECDPGGTLDIVLVAETGFTQAYNGQTGFLRWQAPSIVGGTAAAGADLDRDGEREVLVGDREGRLTSLDCHTGAHVRTVQVFSEPVWSLWVGDLDENVDQEVVAGTTRLSLLKGEDFEVMWEGAARKGRLGHAGIYVTDLTRDRTLDFIFAAEDGVFHSSSDIAYLDLKPPTVTRVTPADGAEHVSRSAPVEVYFSKALDRATVNEETMVLRAGGEPLDYTVAYEPDAFRIRIEPRVLWPGNTRITAMVSAAVADTSGNGLDGNRNGIVEGSPTDDFAWAFSTGAAADSIGPVIVRLAAPDTLWRGVSFRLEVTAADTSRAATSDVVEVVVHLDRLETPPIRLTPVGRAFDSPVVEGWAAFSTSDWPFGDRTLWVVARDREGNWGEPTAVTVHVIVEAEDNWATLGGDARRTGYYKGEEVQPPFAQVWHRIPSRPYYTSGSAVIANGVVYASSMVNGRGVLSAYRVADGERLWQWTGPTASSVHPPAFGYGLVYLQTGNHTPGSYLHALDAATGALVWRAPYDTQWSFWGAPAVSDGRVYVGTGYYGGLSAFDAFTGEHLWQAALPQVDEWAPAVHNGVVYPPVLQRAMWGFDARNGSQRFFMSEFPEGGTWGNGQWAPTIDADLDWAFVSGGGLRAIDLTERTVQWQHELEGWEMWFSGTIAVAEDQLFVLRTGHVVAFDKRTGAELWTSAQGGLERGPIVTRDHVFASNGQQTFAFSRVGGARAWTSNVGGWLSAGNGHLVVASETGLYVFTHDDQVSAEGGADRWELHLASPYPNPARTETTIEYSLPQAGRSSLKVYNLLGQVVTVLHEGETRGGRHTLRWTPRELANGVYLIRLETDGGARTARVVITR